MHDFIPAGEAISGPTTLISGSWGDTLLSFPSFTSLPTRFQHRIASSYVGTKTGFSVKFNTLTCELCEDDEDGTMV